SRCDPAPCGPRSADPDRLRRRSSSTATCSNRRTRRSDMELWFNYADQILLYATLAVSLNLLLGYAGQVSVAHAAFGAIGGYTVGYLVLSQGWNFVPATLIGMGLAFLVGIVLALPAMRLSVEFLILLTLGVSSVILG